MSKPYTVTFGPWLPDIQNVGVEMPLQWSQTELPVADLENVYYQDGSYRCLPGLSSVGPTLGTPILQCFTWYDDTAGKEIVFAATANGFYTLVDGAWTQIPVQQNASAGTVGFAISMRLGFPVGLATWMIPTTSTQTSVSANYTFSDFTAEIGAGTASAYLWSFSAETGSGTWSVASGQGTAFGTPRVIGVTSGDTATATFSCQITVAGIIYNVSGSLSYTFTPFVPVAHTFSNEGATSETIPSDASTLTIELWGPGATGGAAFGTLDDSFGGGGGGAGGYTRQSYTIISENWGQTISVGATNAGSVSVTSGTFSLTTLTATPGTAGTAATSGHNGVGEAGGTGSGGAANTTGGSGANGTFNNGGAGGTAVTGLHGGPYGAGGDGSSQGGVPPGSGGAAGAVFYYT